LATSPTLADMGEVVANHPPETAIIGVIRTRLLLQTVLDACPDDVLKDQKLSGLLKFKDILGSRAHGS